MTQKRKRAYRLIANAIKCSVRYNDISVIHTFFAEILIPELAENEGVSINIMNRKDSWMIWVEAKFNARCYISNETCASREDVQKVLKEECEKYSIKVRPNPSTGQLRAAWKNKD